jgi:extracellular factor (EF) 3-hydroxypalmitic acid methyl ester biosynthesis protein
MWSKDGESKRTPRSQTEVFEGDSGPERVVRSLAWKRKFLSHTSKKESCSMEPSGAQTLKDGIAFISKLYEAGGPLPEEHSLLYDTLGLLAEEMKAGRISKEELKAIWSIFSEEFMKNTLLGHSLNKPFGYAGDYEVIDMMYCQSTYPKYKRWDDFYNNGWAARAVRNRKDYFKVVIADRCSDGGPHRLLNVASGPARDLVELFEEYPMQTLTVDSIEHDSRAIEYAQELCKKHVASISFERANVFKYDTENKYDLIWSAGLFDYFQDEDFVTVLRKLISWTTEKSEVIIGNFTPANPSRNFMEILLDWHLHHRDEDHLIGLAVDAGCRREQLYVGKEEAGVNLFLHVRSR